MGNTCNGNKAIKAHQKVEKELSEIKNKSSKICRLLLLGTRVESKNYSDDNAMSWYAKQRLKIGTSESGKSTIFKQMKVLQINGGYTIAERLSFRDKIYNNLISQMKILAGASMHLCKNLSPQSKENASFLMDIPDDTAWSPEIGCAIKALWGDLMIKELLERHTSDSDLNFDIMDSIGYFFDNINQILDPNFVPTQEDVIRTRVNTLGIDQAVFKFRDLDFVMIDVGGQKSERRKWIHCFQDITAIIYVCSLSEYDQRLLEGNSTMRMQESLLLFDEICNAPHFNSTELVLFLNKDDLFRKKIKNVDLNKCFSGYTGGCNYDEALKFIKQKFLEKIKGDRVLYTHVTCAIDSKNIDFVFNSVRRMLLNKILQKNFVTLNF